MKLPQVMGAIQAYLIALDNPQGTTDAEALSIESEVQLGSGAIEHTIKIVVTVTPKPDETIPEFLRKQQAK